MNALRTYQNYMAKLTGRVIQTLTAQCQNCQKISECNDNWLLAKILFPQLFMCQG